MLMDYDNIYRSACEFFGADRIEDRTWDEIERSGTFKPWEKHTYKFEIDISDHDMGVDEVKQILEDHGYHAEQRFDRRFKNDRSTNLILAVVSEKSKELQ